MKTINQFLIVVLLLVFTSTVYADEKAPEAGQTIRAIDSGGGAPFQLIDLTATAPGGSKDGAVRPAWIVYLCSALSDDKYSLSFCTN